MLEKIYTLKVTDNRGYFRKESMHFRFQQNVSRYYLLDKYNLLQCIASIVSKSVFTLSDMVCTALYVNKRSHPPLCNGWP